MSFTSLILFVLLIYMIVRVSSLNRTNKKIRKVMRIMDHLGDEEEFYRVAEEEVNDNPDPDFRNKAVVLKMFGDAYFRRREEFMQDLEQLDVEALYRQGGNINVVNHEDSFFYLFLAVPNKLYHNGEADLIGPLFDKLDLHAEALDQLLVAKLGQEAKKFWQGTDDRGAEFFRQFLDGEYSGYRYNTQLVGIYKNIAEAFLAKIALDEGAGAVPEEYAGSLRTFAESTLGNRWLNELGIILPPDNDGTEESTSDEGTGDSEA